MEDLLRCLAGMYLSPFNRWNGRGFHAPDRAAWEILLTPQGADFHLSALVTWAPVVEKQLSVIWPRATVERVADSLATVQPSTVPRFELKQHFLFALKTYRRSLGMLPSLLEVSRLLGPAQRVAVQVLLDPAPPDWWQAAAQAYKAFRQGKMPRRLDLDAQGLRTMALRGLAATSLEVFGILSELVSGQTPPAVDLDGTSKALALRERPIGASVAEKLRQDAFELTLRVGIEAEPGTAAQTLLRAVTYALRSLDDGNALVPVPEAPSPG